ncbi:hypothetical protein B0H14DRAFT_1312600 [Mycena olivaceomarginata]|nr:hypothetical protein B0H14DRAFT_1312600 [Mycena olivaceomarginata]
MFSKVTNDIKSYSLINFDPERKSFSIHPLVHGWCRTILHDQESYNSCMCAILGMSIRTIPESDRQLASLRLIAHVDTLMQGTSVATSDFRMEYADVLYYAGRYRESRDLQMVRVENKRKTLGDDHPATLLAMNNLAITYKTCLRFAPAYTQGWIEP